MPLIEKINNLQKQGLNSNEEITQKLKEEGYSPREIEEALDQSKVKSIIANANEEMQPSIMPPQSSQETQNINITQQTQQSSQPPQQISQEISPKQETFEQPLTQEVSAEEYPSYQTYPEYEYQPPSMNTEIITEIAEQILTEKMQKVEKQISEFLRFKTDIQEKVKNIDERLRRIEMMIDRLQISILQRIGDYGRNIMDLKEEMEATQESFSKILNPLTENIQELKKITKSEKKNTKEKKKKKTARGNVFEEYLRR